MKKHDEWYPEQFVAAGKMIEDCGLFSEFLSERQTRREFKKWTTFFLEKRGLLSKFLNIFRDCWNNFFMNQVNDEKIAIPLLFALTQSGKTGVCEIVMEFVADTCKKYGKGKAQIDFVIQENSNALKDLQIERFKKLHADIRVRNGQTEWKKLYFENDAPVHLVIVDECHTGQKINNQMFKNVVSYENTNTNNICIMEVSATAFYSMVRNKVDVTDTENDTKNTKYNLIIMTPGDGYLGFPELIESDRLKQSFSIMDYGKVTDGGEKVLNKWIKECHNSGNTYAIVRYNNNGKDRKSLINLFENLGAEVIKCDSSNDDDVIHMRDLPELLTKAPSSPTVVLIKQGFRAGYEFPRGCRIGLVFETHSNQTNIEPMSTAVQAIGRWTGHHREDETFPIYGNFEAIICYGKLVTQMQEAHSGKISWSDIEIPNGELVNQASYKKVKTARTFLLNQDLKDLDKEIVWDIFVDNLTPEEIVDHNIKDFEWDDIMDRHFRGSRKYRSDFFQGTNLLDIIERTDRDKNPFKMIAEDGNWSHSGTYGGWAYISTLEELDIVHKGQSENWKVIDTYQKNTTNRGWVNNNVKENLDRLTYAIQQCRKKKLFGENANVNARVFKSFLKNADDPSNVSEFIDKVHEDQRKGLGLISDKHPNYVGKWIMCVFTGEKNEEKIQKLLPKAKQAH